MNFSQRRSLLVKGNPAKQAVAFRIKPEAQRPVFPQKLDLIPAWIRLHYSKRSTLQHEEDFWAFEMMSFLVWEQPELAWGIILDILAADSSPRILGNLAAGPFEDLLTKYGERFIDKVEEEAQRNPMFRELLNVVWKNGMSDDVWIRVQTARDQRNSDGISHAPN